MGLPLQVRRESFTSVGQPQAFTKTNQNLSSNSATATEGFQYSAKIQNASNSASDLKQKSPRITRLVVHGVVIALVIAAVGFGRVQSQADLSVSTNSNSDDPVSLIATGAVLAEGTSSTLVDDVSKRAQDISAQSSLVTAGAEYLMKKQPVTVSGAPSRDIIEYAVKDGDTLGSLAVKFNITSDTIAWANNITDENSIKPGVKLTILPVSGILYTGTGADDLGELAARYQANPSLIDSFNALDGKSPNAGQKIIIPEGVKQADIPAPAARIANTVVNATTTVFSVPGQRGAGAIGNSYAYGYCTWYVASRRAVPASWGNAYTWLSAARGSGYGTGSTPRAGAVAWERGNHVAYVERVNGDGTVTVSEMNYWGGGGGWGRRSYRTTSASTFMYIY